MRILFCNNSFPGQFEGLAGYFASKPEHTVLFASSYGRRDFSIAGIRRIVFKGLHDRAPKEKDEFLRQWLWIAQIGREARGAFAQLKECGFEPDVVLFNAGCGESLFLKEAFPSLFRVAYLDTDRYVAEEGREDEKSRFANLIRSMTAFCGHAVFSLSGDARGIPSFLRSSVGVVPPCVDTDFFRPESAMPFCHNGVFLGQETELVSIDGRVLPRTNALPAVVARLLRQRPNCHVLLTGGDRAGATSDAFAAIARAWPGRLHRHEMASRAEYRDMLVASTVHVSPSHHSRARELMEAIGCGTLLLACPSSTQGTDAIIPGQTMLHWPDSVDAQLGLLHNALDDRQTRGRLILNGQKIVREHYAQNVVLPRHAEELRKAYERWKGTA